MAYKISKKNLVFSVQINIYSSFLKARNCISYMLYDELKRFLNEINNENNKSDTFTFLLFSLFRKFEFGQFLALILREINDF